MANKEEKKDLTPEQIYVTQKHGTEPAFSGKYNDTKIEGSYNCICCGAELFSSSANLIREQDGLVFGSLLQKEV